ncbi:hypothetical protein [Ochrobactrum sp. Marseille-Q0166]|uniref:hypothetical protein n=1 Tax=Ochrobactrum sp. Marseille-Q0166 TaxID=2761105 RepID=UPI001654F8AE|nr:hypothetical protein [Ochrobactrum sp. Marseille-Q0166]MBC8719959.1 hypothetical protein [Ochrobactrum sp. Marseille-Q0166]
MNGHPDRPCPRRQKWRRGLAADCADPFRKARFQSPSNRIGGVRAWMAQTPLAGLRPAR